MSACKFYIYIYDYTIKKYKRGKIQLDNRNGNFNSTSNFNGIVMGWEENIEQ